MEKILEKLANSNKPIHVPIQVESFSIINNCFHNVHKKVSLDHGEIVYGWKLHKNQFLEEAERHAVWKSPDGKLIDVTPDAQYKNEVLFLEEDKNWSFDGRSVDNVRVNTLGNPLVDDYILLNEVITKLWQLGKRKSETELVLLEPVAKAIEFLYSDKSNRENHILKGGTVESICYCASGSKYIDCHGKNLTGTLNELVTMMTTIVEH